MLEIKRQESTAAIAESELIINADGSIFHLNVKPEEIADKIILVGDQNRVSQISRHFNDIEVKKSNREFTTHTGTFNGTRITAMSTGIGTDNIDIVLNEIDALFNIDFRSRTINSEKKSLSLLRLGTCGALQEDVDVDSFVASSHGLGFDGLMHFYNAEFEQDETDMAMAFKEQCHWNPDAAKPYVVKANAALLNKINPGMSTGITATANGFYGPQGRILRLPLQRDELNNEMRNFLFQENKILNFEMETSALYGLSAMLGHKACTVCAVIANRYKKQYSKDYKKTVDLLIDTVLQRLSI